MNNTKRIDMRMPEVMIKRLDKVAELTFESRSTIIRRACNKYLNEFDFVKVDKV